MAVSALVTTFLVSRIENVSFLRSFVDKPIQGRCIQLLCAGYRNFHAVLTHKVNRPGLGLVSSSGPKTAPHVSSDTL